MTTKKIPIKKPQKHKTRQKRETQNKIYQVFYKRDPTFMEDSSLRKKDVFDLIDFAYATSIHAKTPDDAYMRMQGENWSPNGEARPLIRSLGLHHTSMSVGDCLYNPSTKKLYQCMDIGWSEVK